MAFSKNFYLLFLLLVAFATLGHSLNLRPIIGVVSEPISPEAAMNNGLDSNRSSYIAASYVKYLEMAGARVVPLKYNAPVAELDNLLQGLNGILYPGGGASLAPGSPFYEAASHMFQFAISQNDKGNYFPVWGTCLGFQFLSLMGANGNHTVLTSGFDSEDLPLPLEFTSAAKSSKLFAKAPSFVYDSLQKEPITMNAHHSGVAPQAAKNNAHYNSFYSILSTNKDRQGREFVSTIESKKYPVYGTQYHPEKIPFEWVVEKEPIPHSFDAVVASQYFANFFVSEARKSEKKLSNENDYLIYNYNASFTGKTGGYFTESYFFTV